MKTENIIILGAFAGAAYLLLRGKLGPAVIGAAKAATGTQEIQNKTMPGQNGYGWRYFSDGTTIDPGGIYRDKNGVILWSPLTTSPAGYDGVSVGDAYLNIPDYTGVAT